MERLERLMRRAHNADLLAQRNVLMAQVQQQEAAYRPPVRPHIIMHMADDLGYYHVGFNADQTDRPSEDVSGVTPHMDRLAKSGIILKRHYVHWHCSPSRRAFLTGRLPIHTHEGLSPESVDHMDLRWKTIGQKLESVGYRCHHYGKGHTGFKSMNHLPVRNGFSSGFLGFLSGNIYHTSTAHRWIGEWPFNIGDSPLGNGTARSRGSALHRFNRLPEESQYSTAHFGDIALAALDRHHPREPLFMYMAWQDPHRPYDPPPGWERSQQSCDGIPLDTTDRRTRARTDACCMFGMIGLMDEYIGKFTIALKEKEMWDNTLVIFVSDNGGTDAGVNYPLRGEKHTTWEGGIRGAAFVAGGVIPPRVQGTSSSVVFSVADWYPTLCTLAGADPRDDPPTPPDLLKLDIYGTKSWPGVDGVNIWPALTGTGSQDASAAHDFLAVTSEVLVAGRFKLIVAQPDPDLMENKFVNNGWRNPNGSWEPAADRDWGCSAYMDRTQFRPCLFDLETDEREQTDLAAEMPELVESLWKQLNATLLTRYTSRSPPELLGPCNEECAFRLFDTNKPGQHPICGVPGCKQAPMPVGTVRTAL